MQAAASTLHLDFPGLQPRGLVVVAVFDSEAAWNKRDQPRLQHIAEAGAQPVRITFNALPAGDYAVMAYHDRNGDGQLNTNFLGIPTEPYGFSNGARGMFGPPGWGKARFSLSQPDTALELQLR